MMTFTLIIAIAASGFPPFGKSKNVRIEASGYSTLAECKADEQQFLGAMPPNTRIIGSGCSKQ